MATKQYQFKGVEFHIQDKQFLPDPQNPTFLGSIDRLSNIQALGSSTKGLKAVAQIAQVGGPKLQGLINKGASGVMDTVMGAGSGGSMNANTVFTQINKINPSAVNTAVSRSEEIVDKLKNGEFNLDTIPTYTRDFAQLFKIGKGIFDAFFGRPPPEPMVKSSVPNYAQSLTDFFGGVKTPFRYVILFRFVPDKTDLQNIPLAFFIKTCERPQMDYDTEDVNFYNYRTKVIKKGTFKPVNMTFYDDQVSAVLTFLTTYLGIYTPVTNIDIPFDMQQRGLDYRVDAAGGEEPLIHLAPHAKFTPNQKGSGHAASMDWLMETTTSQAIISDITILHLYQGGMYFDEYTLHNPKLIDYQMSALDHSASDASTISMTFAYDYFTINPQRSIADDTYSKTMVFNAINAGGTNNMYDLNSVQYDNLEAGPSTIFDYHTTSIEHTPQEVPDKTRFEQLKDKVTDGINNVVNRIA